MDYLKTAPFGGLFSVTFTVAVTFQIVMSVLAILLAVMSPGLFQMNGVPATSPIGAIGVLIFLLTFGIAINAAMSALGALLVVGLRRFLPRSPAH